jgi:thiol:disulfide interchange protein DsbD
MKRLIFGKRTIFGILATLATLALTAAAPDPVEWKLMDGPARPLKLGDRFTVRLVAQVQPGWHMYSMKTVADGPIATRIWLGEGQPFRLAGNVKAAEPMLIQDPSFNMEVETYEGEASFMLPLRVTARSDPGSQILLVTASYQSCNNKICLPPKTIKVSLPVEITR